MPNLYPAIKPYNIHQLRVDKLHVLYLEETGNPQGIPIIVLHSGPGSSSEAYLRRFFDPEIYRIILFDQRGCGHSTPFAETRNNTTPLLIKDVEKIRKFLNLKTILLFGCGWGGMLALLYAETYPQWVQGLLLHRTYLARKKDISWLYHYGANLIFPDYWQDFTNHIPAASQGSVLDYYLTCIEGENELARMAAAKNWALWQAHCSSLQPHVSLIDKYSEPHFALALATLELHFIRNNYFIEENHLFKNIHNIPPVPIFIVHGRYDIASPLATAWELHQALPSSILSIVRDAGHSDYETGVIEALITASRQLSLSVGS